MNNADYWARRFKLMEDALKDQSYEYVLNLEKQFDRAIREIDTQMRAWYQRFAANNGITLAEAQKRLTTGELKEFLWTVEEYIEKGREMNLNGAWIKELENASARVHISRLDSLKYQLRQQAEVLTQARLKATTDAASLAYTQSYYHTAFEVQRGLGVGWTMQAVNEEAVKKVLSRPWTVDNRTFTARCWTDKVKLVETVNQQLTQMLARGMAPNKAVETIAKQFHTTKSNAGRVVMTESAYFASAAQKDCFEELDIERYKVIGTLDTGTCDICGDMDGRVYKMSEYAVGSTAPPFHPWCRCCTAPYFEDMEGTGERYARDADGKAYTVPADMKYNEWAEKTIQKPFTNAEKHGIIRNRITGARDPYGAAAHKHADKYYDFVRSIRTDCAQIAFNTGMDIKTIEAIKQYLFMDTHNLRVGIQRFDADFMIAQSWQRLMDGKRILPHDLTLLHHEELEMAMVKNGLSQDEAHIEASKKFNYGKEAIEYYASLKKYRKE